MDTNPNIQSSSVIEPHINHWHISKRTLALIITLAAFTIFFLFLALYPSTQEKKSLTITPTPTPFAQTTLSLQLTQSSTSAQRSIDIIANTNSNKVTGVQLELGFDPSVISSVTITPANFFDKPLVLFKDINYKTGRISYALGIAPADNGRQGTNTVVTLSYQINPLATASSTKIFFLPKTLVTAEGVTPSVLLKTNDIIIPIAQKLQITTPVLPTQK